MPTKRNEDRLGELLLRWDELRRQGCDVTARELCTDCPGLVEELARRIEAVREVDSILDIEDTAGLSKPCEQDLNGASANRKLPDAWHASAEYRSRRHHARGGLGEILIAHQQELDRPVALKRIRPDKLHDKARHRFLREAAITARLQHPGIVPIYGLGQDDDGPFYTMPFIQGQTLQEAIDGFQRDDPFRRDPGRRSLKFRGLLQQFITVSNTMAYAHDQGIVHRDLKPSNIMLGSYGETLVMDWGLAKPFDGDGSVGEPEEDMPSPSPSPEDLTDTGIVLGTPQYMSPEQANGQPAGPASDIFSLGLIFYAILTGKSAFDEASFQGADSLKAVREVAVVPPRHRDPSVPQALEAICLKALSARPEERYSSARILAEDVTKWLADEPVSAWREPWPYRGRRLVKRHRTVAAATAAACAAALLLGGIGLYSYQGQVRQETSVAEAAVARAEQARSDARAAWSERLDATAWDRAEALAVEAADRDSGRLPVGVGRRLRDLAGSVKAEAMEARADAALLNNLSAVRAATNDPQYDASSEYGQAFRNRGLPVDVGGPAATAAALRNRPVTVVVQIALYLDDWTLLLKDKKGARNQADRITALARALDPDPWRNALREALSFPDRAERKRAVLRLAAAPDVAAQPSSTITLLAAALREAGEPGEAIKLLEPARFQHRDVWIYQELGLSLRAARPPRDAAALRAFTAATTLRPEMGFELARALSDTGQTIEAISVLEEVARRQPEALNFYSLGQMMYEVGRTADAAEMYKRAVVSGRSRVGGGTDDFETHRQLGISLMRVQDFAGAISELREAIRLKPDSAIAHSNLGKALNLSLDLAGSLAEMREAVRLEPDVATYRISLGIARYVVGDLAGAIMEVHEAIRLNPDFAGGHDALGFMLYQRGDRAGAIAAVREAIRLKPDSAQAHSNLGSYLGESGDRAGGIAELREAIRIQPNYAIAHEGLGELLLATRDGAGAVSAFRESIRINPSDPKAHCNLGHALRDIGRFQEALASLERGHGLGAGLPGWHHPSATWVKECRREVELESKLSKVLSGQDRPADAAERAQLASVAARKGLRAAARLFAEAFAAQPSLADDLTSSRRYDAARIAARVGCGKGVDEPSPDPGERAQLRAWALGWLKADLAARAKHLDANPSTASVTIVPQLRRWQDDPDLAGVRDPKELAKRPEPERQEWQALWAGVDALLQQVQERAARPSHPPAGELPADLFAR